MDFLEMLKQAPQDPEIQFGVFLTQFHPDDDKLYAFVEGRDDLTFYNAHIGRKGSVQVTLHRCTSKSKVIDAWTRFAQRFGSHARVMFFVDRDFDDHTGTNAVCVSSDVFITRWYSIENYLICDGIIRALCVELWGMEDSDARLPAICHAVNDALKSFRILAAELCAWCILCRQRGIKCSFDNIDLERLYDVRLDPDVSIVAKYCGLQELVELLEQLTGVTAGTIVTSDVQGLLPLLGQDEPKLYLRGKFELWAFIKLTNQIQIQLQALSKQGGPAFKVRTVLGHGNAVELLSSRIETPPDLIAYLAQKDAGPRP